MANESVIEAAELCALNGRYTIPASVKAGDLLNDVGCWLDSTIATVNLLAIELGNDGSDLSANPREAGKMLWGVFHMLEMTRGAVGASHARMLQAKARRGERVAHPCDAGAVSLCRRAS